MKFLKFLGAKSVSLRAAERRFEILKFLNARHFGSHKQAAEFLKFTPEPSRNRSKILNFMFASYKLKLALRKFTPTLRKFKPMPTLRLNFTLNSIPHARAAKFENGVKFEGAAKFKRSAR